MEKTKRKTATQLANLKNLLVDAGVYNNTQPNEVKYIRFTNLIALVSFVLLVLSLPYTYIYGFPFLTTLGLLNAFSIAAVIVGNRKRHYVLARHFFILLINSFVLICALAMGSEGKIHELFYLTLILPFLLFSMRDVRNLVTGFVTAFIFLVIYQYKHTWFQEELNSISADTNLYTIVTAVKLILFAIAVYAFARYNYENENSLLKVNERLQTQLEELKKINEELLQFDYIISHDLKAPVRNINSFMKLLMTRYGNALEKDGREFIEFSKGSSEKLSSQIDDLIAYCRIDRNLPAPDDVSLPALVKAVSSELSVKFPDKTIHITGEENLPCLKDSHQNLFYTLFKNIVSNSVKFNTNQTVHIHMNYSETNGEMCFSVKDNGIGMDSSYNSKLFQMFRRLHTVGEYEGNGVGLAVCKKIVSMYDGRIWFEGKPEQGTTLYFTIAATNPEEVTETRMKRLINSLSAKVA